MIISEGVSAFPAPQNPKILETSPSGFLSWSPGNILSLRIWSQVEKGWFSWKDRTTHLEYKGTRARSRPSCCCCPPSPRLLSFRSLGASLFRTSFYDKKARKFRKEKKKKKKKEKEKEKEKEKKKRSTSTSIITWAITWWPSTEGSFLWSSGLRWPSLAFRLPGASLFRTFYDKEATDFV